MIEVREYETIDGRHPFSEWLNALRDVKGRARIRTRLDRVMLGNFGDHKQLAEGLFELRFTFGSGYRVYYGRDGDTVVLLLCGGDKSSQKRDIEMAGKYWADYRQA